MPDQSVREMSAFSQKRHSLEAKTFRAAVMSGVVLGLVLLIVGLGLYTVSLTTQYVRHAYELSQFAAAAADYNADTAGLARRVMETYRGLSPEERQDPEAPEYLARFADAAGEDHAALSETLAFFARSETVSEVYLAMYDEETQALVYIVDPAEEEPFPPGYWEPVYRKELEAFLRWDGEGMLYYLGNMKNYGWMCVAGTPVTDAAGQVCAYVMVDVTIGNLLQGTRNYALQIVLALLLVIVILCWLLLKHMKKTLVQPINAIADAAQSYVRDRLAGTGDGGHFTALNIRTGDEVENLSLIMADMERDLGVYEEDLTRIVAEKERIGTELSLATRIQADMLPNIFPAFPERREFDIYASMDPAKEVGGDFYDFFLIDEDHLCMVMADVSGKGVPAALFMMASKIILANNAMIGKSPAQILKDANDAICPNNREEMFVTVWLGILEISTGKLIAANAGHEYPVLKEPGGDFCLVKDKHGFVIGGMAGMQYREYELTLAPGSKLFLYTDGVPEATDAARTLFGTERMLQALNSAAGETPEQILAAVRRAVDDFVRDAEQFDDLTMLCLEYRGGSPRAES